MQVIRGSAQHIGGRRYQQDSFGFSDPNDYAFVEHAGILAVVCDGMGGMEHGDAASQTAVGAFLNAYRQKSPQETIPEALERSAREANDQVLTVAEGLRAIDGMGTTLVAAAIAGHSMYFVSIGDSGVFYVSGNNIQLVNRHHVYANVLEEAVARGEISREHADQHPERESLTSFVGAQASFLEIDSNRQPWPMWPGDSVLLASDGLFKTLSPDEVMECLYGDAQKWPDALIEQTISKQRPFQDNVTVVSLTLLSIG